MHMRLRVINDKHNKWMQLFDSDNRVRSTRPATNEEAWMFGEIQSLTTESSLILGRLQNTEAELEETRLRMGAAEEALTNALENSDEMESIFTRRVEAAEAAREEDRRQYEEIIRDLQARVADLEDKGHRNDVF